MNKHAPRPTEYDGTRFRSKSEAVFARSLDLLSPEHKVLWAYEQPWPLVVGEVADFSLAYKHRGRLVLSQIEYKPSEPTPVYLDEWRGKMAPAAGRGVVCILAFGSPWGDAFGSYYLEPGGNVAKVDRWPMDAQQNAAHARSYRFDLADPMPTHRRGDPVTFI